MSHASSLEKANLGLKKARQHQKKKKMEENQLRLELGEKAYSDLISKRRSKSLKEEVDEALWDYERSQYPPAKKAYFKDLLNERLKEINEPINDFEIKEKRKIEGIINGFRLR